ncbi:MAG: DNA gyrase subunit A, partial [Alphaproteobacteria bacterium]|nr:DNA gyrase subunit A [Alphaproteobacteria bacterium]
VFVSNTHTPVLFFSNLGKVYKKKVYKLPLGSPTSLGKAMINLLPLSKGETITTVMKLPEDKDDCENLYVIFATASGNIRRNKLSDFENVQSNGKIAMKLDDDDKLINVHICDDNSDILLSAKDGKCIRFHVSDVRVFASRASTGVRGIRLGKDDEVISMSILKHVDAERQKREEYLKVASALRRADSETEEKTNINELLSEFSSSITVEDFYELEAQEEFILTITREGFGKRTSAYEYRTTKRGGQGIANIEISGKNKAVIASFPVAINNQIMMVTDGGKLIRMPIDDIRIAGRKTLGVTLFRTASDEQVVSVTCLEEEEEEINDNDDLKENLEVTKEDSNA